MKNPKNAGLMIQEQNIQLSNELKFPLSKNQERMWFLDKLAINKAIYHNPSVINIEGPLNIALFEKACTHLIQKHEQLRVVIKEREEKPFQFIQSSFPLPLSIIKLENSQELDSIIQDIIQTPFNFSQGPLFNFTLVELQSSSFVFIINLHHLISDGWSKSILLKDLLDLYLKLLSGQKPMGHINTISYQDFVSHQLSNSVISSSWKELYFNKIEPLQLASTLQKVNNKPDQGALFPFRIDDLLSTQIFEFTRQNETTPFTFLLSVFSLFLFRLSGQHHFAIGSPVSGRLKKEWEAIVGFFVNTIAVPINIETSLTYLEYLAKLKKNVTKILAHQNLPFEEVVKYLNPNREVNQNPIFQVMFQYDNFPLPGLKVGDLKLTPKTIDFGIAQLDLSLTLWQEQGVFCGTLEYKTDLFDLSTIERFYSYFTSLLRSIIHNPEEQITKLDLIPESEITFVNQINLTDCLLPYQDFLTRFQEITFLHPKNIAIVSNDRSITFRELDLKSNQLAQYLFKLGIKLGSRISLTLPAEIETIVAMVAISKIGAMFSNIDPHTPLNRQKNLIELFKPNLIITHSNEGVFENFHIINVKDLFNEIQKERVEFHPLNIDGSQSLCTIFTSGTTNQPKGVVLTHLSLANIVHSFIQSYQTTTNDKILALSSVASASFLGEVIPSLCSGATLVLTDYQTMLDGNKLVSFIDKHQVSIVSTVPSFIRQLNAQYLQPSSLRYLLSGGEALFAKHISNLKEPLKVINGYGLTEATICSSFEIIHPSHSSEQEDFTLGRPIFNTGLHILDEYGNIAPIGFQGEIGISGLGLMKEYLDDVTLTNQAFIQHPDDKTKKILLTKDIGIRLPDGNIRYIGRKDHQVKIRGFRVNILEIEKIILESGLVKNVAVKAKEDVGGVQLHAVVEAVFNPSLAANIKIWVGERLPSYMVPSVINILPTIPYNQNGKVDWLQIENTSFNHDTGVKPNRPFLSQIEQDLISIWKDILQKEEIDIDHNFFDLGGHSILLMSVHHAIKQKLHCEIDIVHLFKFSTIRSLAVYLQSKDQSDQPQIDHIKSRANMQKMATQERNRKQFSKREAQS